MNDGAEIATDSDDAGHAPGELIAGKYTLLHRLDPLAGTWLARCEAGTAAPRAIFALQLLRFPPSRVDAAAAFEIELRKVEALAHPNLLCPLDHGAHGDQELYVGYEWLKAKTLAQTLREEWPLSDARVVSIMAQLLRALGAAHAAGLAHGDLKPSNLLLVPAASDPQDATQRAAGEHLLVRGLGLAEFSPYRCDETPPEQLAEIMAEWVVGDLDYAAPEQLTGELPSARSDLYAAGILLFQLLTRTVPFTALSAHELAFMHRFAPPEPPSAYALVNPTLEAICLRALSKTPDLRFQSASEMHAALVGALEPDPASSGGAGLAFERARAQLVRVSSVALAPAMRASSTALASLSSARAGAALERTRVHVARISSAALAPVTRAESAPPRPFFRADALSGAPVETAVGQRGQRGFTPVLALATLGVIALTGWWLELSPPDSDSPMDSAPIATTAQGLAGDDSRTTPATEGPWKPLLQPDIDSPLNDDPSLALRTATPAPPLTPPSSPAPELEPVTGEVAVTADMQGAHAALGQVDADAIDPQRSAEAPSPDPSQPPAVVAAPARGAHARPLPAARRATAAVKLLAQPSPAVAQPQPNADSAGSATRASRASASLAPAPAAKASAPAAPPPPKVPELAATQPEQQATAPTPAALARSAPRATPPAAAKRATAFRVELGEPVASRRSVSKGALRSALNADALARCYRAAVAPAAEPSALHATLDITTDLSGRVRSAHLRGAKLEPELVQCVESHARRSRVREGDSSGAMQAAIALTFLAL